MRVVLTERAAREVDALAPVIHDRVHRVLSALQETGSRSREWVIGMASMKTRSRKTRSRPSSRPPRGSEAASGFIFLRRSEYSRLHRYSGDGRYVVDAIEYSRWSIGRKLRLLRREAGLTRADVAFGAKLPLETIARIENGHGDPAEGTVRKIVRAIQRAGR